MKILPFLSIDLWPLTCRCRCENALDVDVAGDVIGADRLAERGKKHIPFWVKEIISIGCIVNHICSR